MKSLAALTFLRLALETAYLTFVSPKFEYAGFTLNFLPGVYFLSWILYWLGALLFKERLEGIRDVFMLLLFINFTAPTLVYVGLAGVGLYAAGVIVVAHYVIWTTSRLRIPCGALVRNGDKIAVVICVLAASILTSRILLLGALDFFSLDLNAVYQYRSDLKAGTGAGVFSYLNIWLTKVFGPFLLAYYLWKRNVFMSCVISLLFIIWFGLTAQKSVLLYPFLIIPIFYGLKYALKTSVAVVVIAASLYCLMLYTTVSDSIFVASLFIRRMLFVVGMNAVTYFEFFLNNPHVFWSNSLLQWLLDYQYQHPAPLLIGVYQGNNSWINNGFLANGYMHFGVVGVILYAALAGVLLSFLGGIAKSGSSAAFVGAAMAPSLRSMLVESDLTVSLVSHGVLVALLLVWMSRGGLRTNRENGVLNATCDEANR